MLLVLNLLVDFVVLWIDNLIMEWTFSETIYINMSNKLYLLKNHSCLKVLLNKIKMKPILKTTNDYDNSIQSP